MLADAGSVAHAVRNALRDSIARWERQKACREARTVLVNALAYDAYIDVAAMICNATAHCAGFSALKLTITDGSSVTIPTTLDATGSYQTDATGTLQQTALTQASDGSVTASWVKIPAKSSAVVRCRFILSGPAPASLVVTAASGTITNSITLDPG